MQMVHCGFRRHAAILVIAAFVAAACSASISTTSQPDQSAAAELTPIAGATSASETAPSTESSAPADTTTPGDTEAPSTESAGPPATVGPSGVRFTKTVSAKRWGDPPFTVVATAADGGSVAYSAAGPCKVGKSSGSVTVGDVGTCTLTATEVGSDPRATDTLSFAIKPARPVIHLGKQSTRFKVDLHYAIKASVDPNIDLTYELVAGSGGLTDDWCAISGRTLGWSHPPTASDFPAVPGDCTVSVRAASTSPNYVAPAPVQAKVHIDYPAWNVHADAQTWSFANGNLATVTVFEDSGDALGIDLQPDGFLCNLPTDGQTIVNAGHTQYTLTVEVQNPADVQAQDPTSVDSSGAYTCTIEADGSPPDWANVPNAIKGTAKTTFTLKVTP
jgi:hypothetical protein